MRLFVKAIITFLSISQNILKGLLGVLRNLKIAEKEFMLSTIPERKTKKSFKNTKIYHLFLRSAQGGLSKKFSHHFLFSNHVSVFHNVLQVVKGQPHLMQHILFEVCKC